MCTPKKSLEATATNRQYHRYEDITDVPDRLRWCRLSRGMTQKEAAGEMGIPIRSLQEWENERKAVSYKCWERYFKGRA